MAIDFLDAIDATIMHFFKAKPHYVVLGRGKYVIDLNT